MIRLSRLLRRMVIYCQLRSLERQADSIIEARQHALTRLIEIQRERCRKKAQLRAVTPQFSRQTGLRRIV